MALSLPDDVFLEILVRVKEAASLFRCATACKQWFRLFADPSFLRQIWPDQHAFSFIGFIAKDKRHGLMPGINGLVIPAPRSPLGPGCRALRSFMPAAYTRLLNGAVPLASRRGLLLVRLGSTLGDSDRTVVHMAVCNLVAGTCNLLPPLKLTWAYDDSEWCGYGILTDVDCRGSGDEQPPRHSPFFRVVIIGPEENYLDPSYSLYTLSTSKIMSWTKRIGCLSIGGSRRQQFSDVTVHRGMAHWLCSWFYLVTLNIQTGHISCTRVHAPLNYQHTGRPCLTTLAMDDNLALLWTHSNAGGPQLDILAPQQDVGGNSDLICTGTIELKPQPRDKEAVKRRLCILGEKCGIILIKGNHQHMFTAELQTGTMEEVVGWPSRCGIIPWESVPLEMDWPSFFISRLRIRDSTRDVGEKAGGRALTTTTHRRM